MAIMLCDNCCGHGLIEYDIGTHKSEYKTTVCQSCKGSGRLIETKTTVHEPFKSGHSAERKF